MIGIYVIAAIALAATGVAIGVLVMVCLGIHRDDRIGGFPAHTNDPVARAARRVTGAGTRRWALADEASSREDILQVLAQPRAPTW